MPVVSIDDKGRMTFPKETGIRGGKAILILMGSTYKIIPISEEWEKYAREWLDTERDSGELKELAERTGRKEAEERARRRDQL